MDTPDKPATPAPPAIVDLDAGENFGARTIPLKRPFKLAGVDYHSLSMRIPTGADVVDMLPGKDVEAEYEALAETLCGLPAGALRKITWADRKTVQLTVGEVLAGGLSG